MKSNNTVLLIYRHPLKPNALALHNHISSFKRYSKFNIASINSKLGFPKSLSNMEFSAIILHYTIFPIALDEKFKEFYQFINLRKLTPIIAFFQDEHTLCKERFEFINDLNIKVIYSLLEPSEYSKVYLDNTNCKIIKHTLTGYVDDSLISASKKFFTPDTERNIDVGYRATELLFHVGDGGAEKTMIAKKFLDYSENTNLSLDIKTGLNSRFNGDDWYKFISNCKAMIGVESGVSIFDIDGTARNKCDDYISRNPHASYNEVHAAVLRDYENNIYYRTISPRIFECAAFKTCMILFEGRYNDILKPNVHYIPLKKDFSNYNEVIRKFSDENEIKRITDNAYKDLIDSNKYSYRKFISDFDRDLENLGISAKYSKARTAMISLILKIESYYLRIKIILSQAANKALKNN